jgi:hypothetical protein
MNRTEKPLRENDVTVRRASKLHRRLIMGIVAGILIFGGTGVSVHAQVIGVSGGYTYFPYSEFSDDDAPADVELQIDSWKATAAFPLAFNDGKTMFLNSVTYDVVNIDYRGPVTFEKIERMHSITLTVFFVQAVSEKWQLVAGRLTRGTSGTLFRYPLHWSNGRSPHSCL